MIHHEYKGVSYVIGDIFSAVENNDIDIIAHQANCMSIMGSGIAKAIREKYPMAYRADVNDERSPEQRLGSYSFCNTGDGVIIFNLYGQYYPGPDTRYHALQGALSQMACLIKKVNPVFRIGLPLIGCGVGGGDWNVVSEILLEELDGLDWTVYVLNDETFKNVVLK